MVRRMKLEAHLSEEEFKTCYKEAKDSIEKERWHCLWLISTGMPTTEVAKLVGRHPQTVRELVWRFNQKGPDSVLDQRKLAKGGIDPVIDDEGIDDLKTALKASPLDHGIWDSSKVAQWIFERTGKTVHPVTAWRYLRKTGWTPQSPRPRSSKTDPEAQEAFKKGAGSKGRVHSC